MFTKAYSYSHTIVVSLILSVMLTSWGCSASRLKNEADSTCQKLISELSEGDYNSAASRYAKIFFAVTPKEEWERFNRDLVKRGGNIIDYDLLSWHIEKSPHQHNPIVATYNYRVEYEHVTTLQLIVLEKVRNRPFKVVKHFYDLMKDSESHLNYLLLPDLGRILNPREISPACPLKLSYENKYQLKSVISSSYRHCLCHT